MHIDPSPIREGFFCDFSSFFNFFALEMVRRRGLGRGIFGIVAG
jgi:hypothetical protein